MKSKMADPRWPPSGDQTVTTLLFDAFYSHRGPQKKVFGRDIYLSSAIVITLIFSELGRG